MERVHVKRSQMNALVMDYLVAEGFKEAAERFNVESGVEMSRLAGASEDMAMLDQRIEVREAAESGKMLDAIRLINKYFPELLDSNRGLFFKLQQQHLIELIRAQDIEGALAFAQEQLSVDDDFLQLLDLERTLALLAFDRPETSPYADLLQLSHRQQLASEINEEILRDQMGSHDVARPQLVTLVKLLLWTQNELDKKKVKYPKMTDLTTATISGQNGLHHTD